LGLVATAAASGDGTPPRLDSGHGGRHTAGRGARRFRRAMVGAQVACVFALASGAALLLRSHDRLLAEERGFDESRLVALVEPQPLESRYPDDASRNDLFRRITERLDATSGVRGAALVAPLPFSGSERNSGVVVPGRADPLPVGVTEVSVGGLDVLGIRLIRGRGFEVDDEGPSSSVAIVGESLAQRLRPGGEVLGTTVELAGGSILRVVGVAADVRQDGLAEPPTPRVWVPWSRIPGDDVSAIAATDGEPARVLPTLRAALAEVDPTLAAERLAPMTALVRETAAFPRFRALVLLILAAAAAAIAGVGIYGVTSYAVVERKRELSIKTALGARASAVLRDALGRELAVVAAGLAFGVVGALLMGRALRGFLHDVAPADPTLHTLTGIAILLLAAAAALVPATRAVRTDPVQALRQE
ncbi:MAG: ABC transporter permease, partial [Gemmatimonadota bacterium]